MNTNCSNFTDIVILAGGIGERLWPLSTNENPKQFIQAADGLSFFQLALTRAFLLKPSGTILVVTRAAFVTHIVAQCRALLDPLPPLERSDWEQKITILPEPEAKHTAAACAFAVAYLAACFDRSERTLLVLTSDHVITPAEHFAADAEEAGKAAAQGNLVCFGIPPTYAATGFGYIQIAGEALRGMNAQGNCNPVLSFREKPDIATAQRYIDTGNYYWNSGMFAFSSSFFCAELQKYSSNIADAFAPLATDGSKPTFTACNRIKIMQEWHVLRDVYRNTPSLSIDTALAEKTQKALCISAHFDWYDVGSWDAFCELFPPQMLQTAVAASENCAVYSDIPVALCGVSDLIVAIHDGKALVLKKGSSSLVKDALKLL